VNYFGDQGLIELSSVLVKNSSIRHLFLDNNMFHKEGLEHLLNALKFNFTIQSVHIDDSFDLDEFPNAEQLMNSIVKTNQNIVKFDKHYCFMNEIIDKKIRVDVQFVFKEQIQE
jgi:hypothetical protein